MTPEKIARAIVRGTAEITADIASGRVPETVRTFLDLHDHVDANEYGGLCEPGWLEYAGDDGNGVWTDATERAVTAVHAALDAWLQRGHPAPTVRVEARHGTEWLLCEREDLSDAAVRPGVLPDAVFLTRAEAEAFIVTMCGLMHLAGDRREFRIVPL